MGKIIFQKTTTKESFQTKLTERVNEYFSRNGLSKKGDWRLHTKTAVLFSSFAIAYACILFAPYIATQLNIHVLWIIVTMSVPLGLIVAAMGFNVMHDASHKSYSDNPKVNNLMAFVGGDLMGGSTFIWNIKHNRLHHTFTNIEGYDDDIAKYPMFRMNVHQKRLWFHKYQFLYAPVLYMILSMHWTIINDATRMVKGKVLIKELRPKQKDIWMFILGKALHFILFVGVPMIVAPVWWYTLVGFAVMHVTIGLTLAFVFQMAHVVEGTAFPEPPKMDEWMLHQLETTSNFAMNDKLLSWYVGGLNFQIEHHLFSNISHIHYPALSKIVQRTCKEFGIPYNSFPTFRQALWSHFVYLKKMGRKPYAPQAA